MDSGRNKMSFEPMTATVSHRLPSPGHFKRGSIVNMMPAMIRSRRTSALSTDEDFDSNADLGLGKCNSCRNVARSWCTECKVGLCNFHRRAHGAFKETDKHRLLSHRARPLIVGTSPDVGPSVTPLPTPTPSPALPVPDFNLPSLLQFYKKQQPRARSKTSDSADGDSISPPPPVATVAVAAAGAGTGAGAIDTGAQAVAATAAAAAPQSLAPPPPPQVSAPATPSSAVRRDLSVVTAATPCSPVARRATRNSPAAGIAGLVAPSPRAAAVARMLSPRRNTADGTSPFQATTPSALSRRGSVFSFSPRSAASENERKTESKTDSPMAAALNLRGSPVRLEAEDGSGHIHTLWNVANVTKDVAQANADAESQKIWVVNEHAAPTSVEVTAVSSTDPALTRTTTAAGAGGIDPDMDVTVTQARCTVTPVPLSELGDVCPELAEPAQVLHRRGVDRVMAVERLGDLREKLMEALKATGLGDLQAAQRVHRLAVVITCPGDMPKDVLAVHKVEPGDGSVVCMLFRLKDGGMMLMAPDRKRPPKSLVVEAFNLHTGAYESSVVKVKGLATQAPQVSRDVLKRWRTWCKHWEARNQQQLTCGMKKDAHAAWTTANGDNESFVALAEALTSSDIVCAMRDGAMRPLNDIVFTAGDEEAAKTLETDLVLNADTVLCQQVWDADTGATSLRMVVLPAVTKDSIAAGTTPQVTVLRLDLSCNQRKLKDVRVTDPGLASFVGSAAVTEW